MHVSLSLHSPFPKTRIRAVDRLLRENLAPGFAFKALPLLKAGFSNPNFFYAQPIGTPSHWHAPINLFAADFLIVEKGLIAAIVRVHPSGKPIVGASNPHFLDTARQIASLLKKEGLYFFPIRLSEDIQPKPANLKFLPEKASVEIISACGLFMDAHASSDGAPSIPAINALERISSLVGRGTMLAETDYNGGGYRLTVAQFGIGIAIEPGCKGRIAYSENSKTSHIGMRGLQNAILPLAHRIAVHKFMSL